MRERGSVRRRREDAPEEELRPAARQAPATDAILALQRSAGNRALQRLVWNETTGNLAVPTEYGEQKIRWNGTHKDDVTAEQTFTELAKSDRNFQAEIKKHLGIQFLADVKQGTAADFERSAPGHVAPELSKSDVEGDKAVYAKMVYDVGRAAASHNIVLTVPGGGQRLADLQAIQAAQRLVLRPDDFLPEEADLPPEGTDLLKEKIPDTDDKKYWEYTCVLIALFKDGGLQKAKDLTNKKLPNDVYKVVYALHDYYVRNNIQYDDGSVRAQMMKDWGYTMIWAGRNDWDKLAGEVELQQGSYIFDITGHTVQVDVLQNVYAHTTITDPKLFFKPNSDGKNYTKDAEWKQKVTAIYKK